MMKNNKSRLLAVIAGLIFCLTSTAQDTKTDTTNAIEKSRIETIDGIINSVYDIISSDPGERNWVNFKALFLPDARVISITKDDEGEEKFYNVHIDEYIEMIAPILKDKSYDEIEIGRQVEEYNNVGTIFSTFQSTLIEGDEITVKNGINCLQLVYYHNRWWIASVLWNNETKEHLIPNKYKIPAKKLGKD